MVVDESAELERETRRGPREILERKSVRNRQRRDNPDAKRSLKGARGKNPREDGPRISRYFRFQHAK